MRSNPIGLRAGPGTLLHVGGLGERIHMMNEETGLALCAPNNFDVRPVRGVDVTCGRCRKLMGINRSLRGSYGAIGTAKAAVDAAAARRR